VTLSLPDCSRLTLDRLLLDEAQLQGVIKAVAEGGREGLENYLEDEVGTGSGTLAEWYERLTADVTGWEMAERSTMEDGTRSSRKEAQDRFRELMDGFSSAREGLEERLALRDHSIPRVSDSRYLSFLVQDGDVSVPGSVHTGDGKRSGPGPLRRALRRIFLRMAAAFLGLLIRLGLRKARVIDRVILDHPVPGGQGTDLGSTFTEALWDNRGLQKDVDDQLMSQGFSGLQLEMTRELHPEDYEDLARRLLKEDLEKEAEARKVEMEKELAELSERMEDTERTLDETIKGLDGELERSLNELQERSRRRPLEDLTSTVRGRLESAGMVSQGSFDATGALVSRFSSLVLAEEMRDLGVSHSVYGDGSSESRGEYQKDSMRTHYEVSRLDMVESLLAARMNHPGNRAIQDDDVVIFRERREDAVHVVVCLDRSYSMEENERINAGKRAVLALHRSVLARNPRNRVDLILYDTTVESTDLLGLWNAGVQGFTNIGGALRTARQALNASRASRKVVYLITDGLPEALTDDDGVDRIADPEDCLEFARVEASACADSGIRLHMLLLEEHDQRFVEAGKAVAVAGEGNLLLVDSGILARQMVREFLSSDIS